MRQPRPNAAKTKQIKLLKKKHILGKVTGEPTPDLAPGSTEKAATWWDQDGFMKAQGLSAS